MPKAGTPSSERRHFWRVPFHAPVQLTIEGRMLQTRLLDISLRGALLGLADSDVANVGDLNQSCTIKLPLEGNQAIVMQASIVHRESGHIGLRCDVIDVDSITHLRRLVELNAEGDADQVLERDLSALVDSSR